MPLMKAQQAGPLLKDAIVLDMGDLRRQAKQIIAIAERKARRDLAEAQREAARMAKQTSEHAFEEGRAEGLQRGLTEGRQAGRDEALEQASNELAQIQATWLETGTQMQKQLAQIEKDARDAVLQLALTFAKKLVHRVIEVDPAVIVDQVASAVEHLLRPINATVRICPDDRPTLEEVMPQLMEQFAQLKHVHLVDDPQLARGGCVISYGQGVIDASLDTQMRRLVECMVPNEQQPSEPTIHQQSEGKANPRS